MSQILFSRVANLQHRKYRLNFSSGTTTLCPRLFIKKLGCKPQKIKLTLWKGKPSGVNNKYLIPISLCSYQPSHLWAKAYRYTPRIVDNKRKCCGGFLYCVSDWLRVNHNLIFNRPQDTFVTNLYLQVNKIK